MTAYLVSEYSKNFFDSQEFTALFFAANQFKIKTYT